MDGHGGASIKPYVWILKFEFPGIFIKYYFFLLSFQPLKNVKTIHSSQAVQKLTAVWIYP